MIVAALAIGFVLWTSSRSSFSRTNPGPMGIRDYPNERTNPEYNPGFLPSHQGPHFEGLPPSLRVENDYHRCIQEIAGGDYGNYEARQKCYIKTMKNGTFDKADLICWRHRNDEDAYYACLDSVYGNYLWMDRWAGVKPCRCEDGSTGVSNEKDECVCPSYRPLHDRRMTDGEDRIVGRVW